MNKYFKLIPFFIFMLFLSGCSIDLPTTKEIAFMEISAGPGAVLILLVITIILSWISGNSYLKLNKKMRLQYFILFILCLAISITVTLSSANSLISDLFFLQLMSIMAIPYLLLLSSLLLAVIPTKYSFYLPTLVLLIYYISALIVINTDNKIFDLVLLTYTIWFISIPIFVISLFLFMTRYRNIIMIGINIIKRKLYSIKNYSIHKKIIFALIILLAVVSIWYYRNSFKMLCYGYDRKFINGCIYECLCPCECICMPECEVALKKLGITKCNNN
ncbi:MAG: hypothetical protein ABIG60_05255 [Patescibacteria group bacterium]